MTTQRRVTPREKWIVLELIRELLDKARAEISRPGSVQKTLVKDVDDIGKTYYGYPAEGVKKGLTNEVKLTLGELAILPLYIASDFINAKLEGRKDTWYLIPDLNNNNPNISGGKGTYKVKLIMYIPNKNCEKRAHTETERMFVEQNAILLERIRKLRRNSEEKAGALTLLYLGVVTCLPCIILYDTISRWMSPRKIEKGSVNAYVLVRCQKGEPESIPCSKVMDAAYRWLEELGERTDNRLSNLYNIVKENCKCTEDENNDCNAGSAEVDECLRELGAAFPVASKGSCPKKLVVTHAENANVKVVGVKYVVTIKVARAVMRGGGIGRSAGRGGGRPSERRSGF